MLTDLDPAGLAAYRSDHETPPDFDAFWQSTVDATRAHDLDLRVTPVATDLVTLDVFDVTFAGFGGHPIHAWLRLPRAVDGPLPAVVQFHGYANGRGAPIEELLWASAGYAHLLVDVRGQGGQYAGGGATPDPVGSGPSHPGFLTRGIEDPENYFYRRVFADAVRAVDAVRALSMVDPQRVGVVGASQGGGIALAIAGLTDVAGLHVQAPFLCDIRRATMITGTGPYLEISEYLAARRTSVRRVFDTLAYFDGVGFARRATAPAWFSAGLMDDLCPPSTAFGAYHAYAGPKHIQVWDYNGHEAGGPEDLAIALTEFRALLKPEE